MLQIQESRPFNPHRVKIVNGKPVMTKAAYTSTGGSSLVFNPTYGGSVKPGWVNNSGDAATAEYPMFGIATQSMTTNNLIMGIDCVAKIMCSHILM